MTATRTLFIPERSDDLALTIAYAVMAGTIPCLEQYRDENRASACAEVLGQIHADRNYRARCVVMERRTVDDGYIWVGKVVDRSAVTLGDVAAAIMLFVVGPFAVGFASLF